MTSSARTSSSPNLRTTTKRSMAGGRGDGECVWKHSCFCKDGDVLIKSLAVCRICKSQVKKNTATRLISPTTYYMGFHTTPTRNNNDLGNFTCTVLYPGIYFTVTLVDFLAKKLLNRFQVTESDRIVLNEPRSSFNLQPRIVIWIESLLKLLYP